MNLTNSPPDLLTMKQKFLSGSLKKTAQSTLCGVLAALLSASPPAGAATNETDLRSELASGGTVTITQDVTFSHTGNAIILNQTGITLKGDTASNFGTSIGSLSSFLPANLATVTDTVFNSWVNGWYSTFNTGSLVGIQGDGTTRNKTHTDHTQATGETTKWLTSPNTTAFPANGLSLQNLHLSNVNVEYEGNRFVNGLIGNNHLSNADTTMDDITGNAFTGINVGLTSTLDTHYLAGGGIVGVRATGELSPASASAEMGNVSGNLFEGITITATGTGFTGFDPAHATANESTYLEGGGLVGVNAVSSPGDVQGHATMPELSNNYFTSIDILSNDVLMGGGLVGLNNNSKHENTPPPGNTDDWALSTTSNWINTYARLDNAQGNIFGDGTTGDINVQVGYSLRGGGVLGLNGLSSAQVELLQLTDNAFAGIAVETGSYVRGGGIVGLQTNDGAADKPSIPGSPADGAAAMAFLGNASNNLFLNEQITVGTYMEGGGVIGLRSNKGRSAIVALLDNVFKDITVLVKYNDSPSMTQNPNHALSGGGIIGLSSAEKVNLGVVQGNTFANVTVDASNSNADPTKGNLFGGGIIGMHALNPDNVFADATIEMIDNNTFSNVNVSAKTLNGGGLIGGANENGLVEIASVNNHTFTDRIMVNTDEDLVGGGIVGVWAADAVNSPIGSHVPAMAVIDGITNNTFTTTVNVGGNLVGGGIIGARSNNVSALYNVANNTFANNKIKVGGYIDGGGIIGITGSAAYGSNAPIAIFKSIDTNTFTGNKVAADGMIMGGLVYSYGLANNTGSSAPDGLTINKAGLKATR
jgi:hypothetical protein